MGNMDNSKEILVILSGLFIFSLLSFSSLFVFLFFRKKTTYIQTKYDLHLKEKELDKMNALLSGVSIPFRQQIQNQSFLTLNFLTLFYIKQIAIYL